MQTADAPQCRPKHVVRRAVPTSHPSLQPRLRSYVQRLFRWSPSTVANVPNAQGRMAPAAVWAHVTRAYVLVQTSTASTLQDARHDLLAHVHDVPLDLSRLG